MFYARLHPRGFSNEYHVLAFETRELRDQFVASVPRTRHSGYYNALVPYDNESARAYRISAREAARETLSERRTGYDSERRYIRDAGYRKEPLTLREYLKPAATLDDVPPAR